MDDPTMRSRVTGAPVGRLATVRPDGRPHVVVCCFALDGETAYTAVDDKPKSTRQLQRLRNLAAHPEAAILVDHYEDDWTALWWVRLDGRGRLVSRDGEHDRAMAVLAGKYEPYRRQTPTGPLIAIDIDRWTAWP
jgi:PPOX class probable F420-dependent enzyme